ncbi:MAG: histidine kinase [Lachnospiraceae bacterium]|nr:histidine kinase [Lachnospiraceae bacterium]
MRKLWKWFTGKASIRKKLVISFTILILIPVMVLGTYAFMVANHNLMRQTEETMENNLSRLEIEMDASFQRENDFMKYLAYNLEFRNTLENNAYNNAAIAQTLNKTVEPVFWYFITSDLNIKGIEIITPLVHDDVGSFLKSASHYEQELWYRAHQTNFNTVWSVEDGRLYATRTILDTATTSKPIGVMRTEFYMNRMIQPISSMEYLDNGIVVLDDAGNKLYVKDMQDAEKQMEIESRIHADQTGNRQDRQLLNEVNQSYLLKSVKIQNVNWTVCYFVDREMISDQVSSILTSTLLLVFICLVVIFIFVGLFSTTLSRRIMLLKGKSEEIAAGDLENPYYTEDTDEIGVVTNAMAQMTERLNETINKVYKIEIEKKATELKALQAQINPHFLYNCLSSIKWKALRKGDDEIADITGLIAKFYRTALNNGQQITTVRNELENIRSYVDIQRATHDNDFQVEYRISEEGLECKMLNFLLQPIVENAIKHGIDYMEEGHQKGLVIVEHYVEGDFLIFHIYNNGPELNMDTLEEVLSAPAKGYGIFNIRERIAMYYGGSCALSASITPEKYTCFTVKIYKKIFEEAILRMRY